MTRQLDPTILRFFTVSRIISPASETCLCKFHIKIEYFLTRRHPPCAQTLSALRFLHQHSPIIHQTTPSPHFPPPSNTTPHTKFQKPAFHGLAYLRPHFPRFHDTPEKTPKASLVPYVPNPILFYGFHYGKVVPEPSSARQIFIVSYPFLSIYIYVYVSSDFLRFTTNPPFIVSYFFIWCFGYAHSRIPYMVWVGFRTAFTDGTGRCELQFIEETVESFNEYIVISTISVWVDFGFCVSDGYIVSSLIQGISRYSSSHSWYLIYISIDQSLGFSFRNILII